MNIVTIVSLCNKVEMTVKKKKHGNGRKKDTEDCNFIKAKMLYYFYRGKIKSTNLLSVHIFIISQSKIINKNVYFYIDTLSNINLKYLFSAKYIQIIIALYIN